jgi:hypothetical protein
MTYSKRMQKNAVRVNDYNKKEKEKSRISGVPRKPLETEIYKYLHDSSIK